MKIIYLFQSMRPQQWIKNLLIFAALIFSKNLTNIDYLLKTIYAFFIFCFLSGSVYLINDILDFNKDKEHSEKSKRPIVSGKLSKSTALVFSLLISLISLLLSFLLNINFGYIALIYLVLNLIYSYSLKKIVIIDVMVLAGFYVIRAIAGAEVIKVEISSWLIICTLLLALFLALGKRRHELIFLAEKAINHRTILKEYSTQYIDQMVSVVTASTVLVYILYTVSDEVLIKFGTNKLIYTVPFVLYGIFRYLYLIHQKEASGSPSRALITDKPILINIALWLLTVILIIYVKI